MDPPPLLYCHMAYPAHGAIEYMNPGTFQLWRRSGYPATQSAHFPEALAAW